MKRSVENCVILCIFVNKKGLKANFLCMSSGVKFGVLSGDAQIFLEGGNVEILHKGVNFIMY
jgi:hypothetical protein